MIENMEVIEKICIESFNFNEFKKKYLFEGEEEDYDLSHLKDIDAILIESLFIKEKYQKLGYGSKVVENLKKHNKSIIVYSVFKSLDFWEKQGFESVNGHEYIYIYTL